MGAEGTQRLPHTYPVLKHSQKGAQQPSSTGTAFPVPVRSDFCEEESIRSTGLSLPLFESNTAPAEHLNWG